MDSVFKLEGNKLLLQCYLQPRASKNEFVGIHDNSLKIRITTPPIDGKANRHLTKFIAKQFGVTMSKVALVKGKNSRHKILSINAPYTIPSCLSLMLTLD